MDPSITTPALLWNGLIGVRIGRDGFGVNDGFLSIDEYQPYGEEKVIPLQNPVGLRWRLRGEPLDPAQGSNYRQSIDMRDGVLRTEWDQAGGHIALDIAIDPNSAALAERWTLDPGQDGNVSWAASMPEVAYTHSDTLGTRSVQIGDRQFTEVVQIRNGKHGQWNGSVWEGRSDSEPAISVERYIYLAPKAVADSAGEPFPDVPADHWAYKTRVAADGFSVFDPVEQASKDAWTRRWKTDIEIDGPVEDQQAVRSFLFYLRSAIPDPVLTNPHPLPLSPPEHDLLGEGKGVAISPFGLSDPTYFGHVFWDADIWVFPALALVDPAIARALPDYRLAHVKAAEENYDAWLNAGRPTADKPLGRIEDMQANPSKGLKFPWESSVSGHETVPGPSKFEDHITGDVAFSLGQARALGMVDDASLGKVLREANQFWSSRWERNANGENEIKSVMSVDEKRNVDNDLYTNLLAQWCANGGSFNSLDLNQWQTTITQRRFKLAHDDKSLLTYDDDPGRGYKQAAAVLAIYPLQYPEAEKEARVMMDRFADRVIPHGPAMTDAIHSIIWSRLGERDKAYETWRKSWQQFTNHPLMLFSEKRTLDTSYFTTGAAGSLQSVLYGFLGFRLDYKKQDGAAWSLPLRGGSWLSVKPHLPPSWKSVKFKNFTVLGHRYTLTATPTNVHVTQGD